MAKAKKQPKQPIIKKIPLGLNTISGHDLQASLTERMPPIDKIYHGIDVRINLYHGHSETPQEANTFLGITPKQTLELLTEELGLFKPGTIAEYTHAKTQEGKFEIHKIEARAKPKKGTQNHYEVRIDYTTDKKF